MPSRAPPHTPLLLLTTILLLLTQHNQHTHALPTAPSPLDFPSPFLLDPRQLQLPTNNTITNSTSLPNTPLSLPGSGSGSSSGAPAPAVPAPPAGSGAGTPTSSTCGSTAYAPATYTCIANSQLCPLAAPQWCAGDKACYSPSQYTCTNGHLGPIGGGGGAPGAGAPVPAGGGPPGGGVAGDGINQKWSSKGNSTGSGVSPGFAGALAKEGQLPAGGGPSAGAGAVGKPGPDPGAGPGGIMGGTMNPDPGQLGQGGGSSSGSMSATATATSSSAMAAKTTGAM